MVDVNTQNKTISVNVSSSGVSSNVNASGDTTMYYSNKAREWAISNRIVDGVDYSSKYYAEKSNQSALNAQSFAQSAQDSYNNLQQSVEGALSDIDSSVQGAIDEINNTKTNIITDIEFVADGEKQEIEELIDTGKDELKEAIGDVKVLTTLKIGQIGIAPLGIDETLNMERYLNGQIIIQDQFKGFTNYLKRRVELYPSVACTEEEWQTEVTMSAFSQCGKFVIDDNAGTIRLPKVVNIQGLTDLSKLAEIVKAGLPTHTHTRGNMEITGALGDALMNSAWGSGAFADISYSGATYGAGSNSFAYKNLNFYASKSWTGSTSTGNYSKALATTDTVQQEQIQYPYFIQVATGAETEDNIVNEIELNNPFSLLDYKYSEYELNNVSWLRSEGQYNSKAIYPAVYDLLLKIYNGTETKAGVSVKLHTEDYTDEDFVINQDDETFRLQLITKDDFVVESYTNGTEWYRVYKSGWVEQGGIANIPKTGGKIITLYKSMKDNKYSTLLTGETYSGGGMVNDCFWVIGQTTTTIDIDMSSVNNTNYCRWYVCGQGADISTTKTYFYVGETVQNANLVNIGRIQETYTTKSMVDGKWVPARQNVLQNVGMAARTERIIDLSNYLPNDGYAYEIIIGAWVRSGATSGYAAELNIYNEFLPEMRWVTAVTRTSNNNQASGVMTLPVGLERNFTLKSVTDEPMDIISLGIRSYRRIGTNL